MSVGLRTASSPIRFSVFEFDQKTGVLRKHGSRLRIEGQPLQILALLLEEPGEIVTREELKQKLWAETINVDFEHGINTGIRRIREALGDCAETPRFIETVPRRGYRFIYPLSSIPVAAPTPPQPRTRVAMWLSIVAILVALVTAFSIYSFRSILHRVPKISSLAVLPLANVSGDASQEYFADGITDELITNVSKIPGLKVISRTSVMRYKGESKTSKGLPAIARELNVDAVIEGTVLRSGNRVRVTVQLIHADSDTHLWAETYERDLRDVIALQDEVTLAIAHEIRVALTGSEEKQLARKRSVDPRAYELYLKGRYYFSGRMVEMATASFTEAIKLQPDYAEAYAGLGESFILYELANAARPEEAVSKGKAAALRALEIDDSVAEAHVTLAWARMAYDRDWVGAEGEFRRAIALNPNYKTAHLWYGCELIWEKRFAEGLAEMKRAQDVAPADPWISAFFAMGFYQARQYEKAMEQSKLALDLDRTNAVAHEWLGFTYLAVGKKKEAVAELEEAVHFSTDQHMRESVAWSRLGYLYGQTGQRKQADAVLAKLRSMSAISHVPATDFALVYTGFRETSLAFSWLNKAYGEHAFELAVINADPRFDSLRSDPRFQELIRRMNFPK